MRLRTLRANTPGFRRITFNESGLSIILARQEPGHARKGNTYNGVGKSLAASLADYCLGSSNKSGLKTHLPGWVFTLDVILPEGDVSLSRGTDKQSRMEWNGLPKSRAEVVGELQRLVFNVPAETDGVTFRLLVKPFLRVGRDAYKEPAQAGAKEQPYSQLARQSLLLGLDTSLVTRKKRIRDGIQSTRQRSKALFDDPVFVDWATGGMNVEVAIEDAKAESARLYEELDHFVVAEDYEEMQQRTIEAQGKLQKTRNELHLIERRVRAIESSLDVRSDLDFDEVEAAYAQAEVALGDAVIRSLAEVKAFHQALHEKRQARLLHEREAMRVQRERAADSVAQTTATVEGLMKYLGAHSALDEYRSLSLWLGDVEARLQKLQEFRELERRYSLEIQRLQLDFDEANLEADEYLAAHRKWVAKLMSDFRALSGRFYPSRPGGLTVRNNIRANTTRFNIDAHIPDDASDGINEVRIFCYDVLTVRLQQNHSLKFLWHDSRMFADVDPRQRAEMFRVAMELPEGIQYIASLNQDQLEAMKPILSPAEYERLLRSVVVQLTDKSHESKLLGRQVDLKY